VSIDQQQRVLFVWICQYYRSVWSNSHFRVDTSDFQYGMRKCGEFIELRTTFLQQVAEVQVLLVRHVCKTILAMDLGTSFVEMTVH
jgi:hypothetical protein